MCLLCTTAKACWLLELQHQERIRRISKPVSDLKVELSFVRGTDVRRPLLLQFVQYYVRSTENCTDECQSADIQCCGVTARMTTGGGGLVDVSRWVSHRRSPELIQTFGRL